MPSRKDVVEIGTRLPGVGVGTRLPGVGVGTRLPGVEVGTSYGAPALQGAPSG